MSEPQITVEQREQLADAFDIDESADRLTLQRLREAIDAETDPEYASMGEAIRSDLSGELDSELIGRELARLEEKIGRIEEVRTEGIPDGEEEAEWLYRELIEPAWTIYDHLAEVGFFESIEENLPPFTEDHIENTANELLEAGPLAEALESAGFDDREQMVLMMNVVNNNTRLSRWVPTREIPDGVEFDVEHVPPLHQRSMGGALLWIKALDTHLWQKEVLITEEILDDAEWFSKAMLGGVATMARGAEAVALGAEGTLTDAQVTAALSGGAAIQIINQEEIMKNVFWITEDDRKPPEVRDPTNSL